MVWCGKLCYWKIYSTKELSISLGGFFNNNKKNLILLLPLPPHLLLLCSLAVNAAVFLRPIYHATQQAFDRATTAHAEYDAVEALLQAMESIYDYFYVALSLVRHMPCVSAFYLFFHPCLLFLV